jgi:hypothetical protein
LSHKKAAAPDPVAVEAEVSVRTILGGKTMEFRKPEVPPGSSYDEMKAERKKKLLAKRRMADRAGLVITWIRQKTISATELLSLINEGVLHE